MRASRGRSADRTTLLRQAAQRRDNTIGLTVIGKVLLTQHGLRPALPNRARRWQAGQERSFVHGIGRGGLPPGLRRAEVADASAETAVWALS